MTFTPYALDWDWINDALDAGELRSIELQEAQAEAEGDE